MDLNEISVFIQVVKEGSFSKAAKKLGMPNSTVSSKVSSLERRLATTLIQRTTRQLKVTAAGEAYFEKCNLSLQEIQNAEREVLSTQLAPQGLIRMTAPVELGSKVLPPVISRYLSKFQNVQVKLELSDNVTDLISHNFDVALRIGKLQDSTLVARKVGVIQYALFATPEYLKKNARPKHPRDLRQHSCLAFNPGRSDFGSVEWKLESKSGPTKISIPHRVELNNLSALKSLLMLGNGIAFFPAFLIKDELARGEVVRVLPEWSSSSKPVHLVYPPQKHLPPRLSEFLKQAFEMIPTLIN
ncbi:MAG: LysR family transcriptional regulator [Bacteriovoracaceae bacterium]|nr:LysR family transcriptional regulator [Bacteriovoracaceae bacterium]